jgi:type I restriction enzyme, S subunit
MNSSEGWENITVEDLGEIVAGGTPDRTNPSYWGGSIPWVTPTEITGLKGKYLRETAEYITEAGLAGSAARLLPIGTVVVTTRATLGETAIATVPLATNQGFKNVVPNKETDSLFAYYLLRTLRPEMIRLSSGTTFLEISKSDFARIKTRRPKIDDQRRIAAVLGTMDEAIAKTEAVIAKLKQVRAGLLHDLLTRGLKNDREFRPPFEEVPGIYRETSIGWIPKEWVIGPLGSFFTLQRGFDITQEQQEQGNIAVVSSSGITSYHSKAMCEGPGVIIGRKGKLGDAYYSEGPYWPHDTTLWVKDFHGNFPKFVWLFLRWLRLKRFDAATSVPTLNRNFIHPMLVAIPRRNEQENIVSNFQEIEENIHREELWLSKLCVLKIGLMSDLLTGRVRVPEGII